MANMSMTKNAMPVQDPVLRAQNFKEVAMGYTAEKAIDEARRCLGCKNAPCRSGCPVSIDIPAFIQKVAEGDFAAAYQIIAKDSSLPAVCGRVCPQETQCESKCVRGIKGESVAIGRLERFVADWYAWQNELVNRTDLLSLTNAPVFRDCARLSRVIPCKNKILLKESAVICLYGDRITVDDRSFPFSQIHAVVVLGKNKLNIYDGNEILQLKGDKRFNALKYVNFYHRYKNIQTGESNGKFLGL